MELKVILLAVFAVVSAAHLVSTFFKNFAFQAITKGLLMPLCLSLYIFGANRIILPVILALVFAWAGDIFLLKISDLLRFRLGLASFLIGHICYIIAMYGFVRPFNVLALIISAAAAVCLSVVLFKIVKPNNEMKIPVIAYETIIFIMAIFALQLFFAQGGTFGAFVLAGSLCFVASDSILAFVTFRKKPPYGDFLVMLTYIAAQLCITLGFCQVTL